LKNIENKSSKYSKLFKFLTSKVWYLILSLSLIFWYLVNPNLLSVVVSELLNVIWLTKYLISVIIVLFFLGFKKENPDFLKKIIKVFLVVGFTLTFGIVIVDEVAKLKPIRTIVNKIIDQQAKNYISKKYNSEFIVVDKKTRKKSLTKSTYGSGIGTEINEIRGYIKYLNGIHHEITLIRDNNRILVDNYKDVLIWDVQEKEKTLADIYWKDMLFKLNYYPNLNKEITVGNWNFKAPMTKKEDSIHNKDSTNSIIIDIYDKNLYYEIVADPKEFLEESYKIMNFIKDKSGYSSQKISIYVHSDSDHLYYLKQKIKNIKSKILNSVDKEQLRYDLEFLKRNEEINVNNLGTHLLQINRDQYNEKTQNYDKIDSPSELRKFLKIDNYRETYISSI